MDVKTRLDEYIARGMNHSNIQEYIPYHVLVTIDRAIHRKLDAARSGDSSIRNRLQKMIYEINYPGRSLYGY